MSYDVAVWEGNPAGDDTAALSTYCALWERYDDSDELPSAGVLQFVDEITATYPDIDDLSDEDADESPWATAGLSESVKGPFVYLTLVPSKADETIPFVAETARRHGLVCFDPQTERLITTSERPRPARDRSAPSPWMLGAVGGVASGLLTYLTGTDSWVRAALTGAAVGACLLVLFLLRARLRP